MQTIQELRARAQEGDGQFFLALLPPCFVTDFLSSLPAQVTSEPCFQQQEFQNPEMWSWGEPGSCRVLSEDWVAIEADGRGITGPSAHSVLTVTKSAATCVSWGNLV